MEIILNFLDFILHLDTYLVSITQQYGVLTYGVLFFIIFAETGFVVTPFLPGDSLLFAAGALSAVGALNPFLLFVILGFAAIAGDTINYWLGYFVGPKVFSSRDSRFLNKKHLDRTHQFYEKHGGKTIILARFIPIIRTFAPFVAGIGKMTYLHFLSYNVVGGVAWIAIFVFAGFFFGNLPIVRQNFSLIIVAIILISVTPIVADILKTVWNNSKK